MLPDRDEADYAPEEGEAMCDSICDYAGHDWQEAGGGMQMCAYCAAERWDPRLAAFQGTQAPGGDQ